jgi:hypothetical protein
MKLIKYLPLIPLCLVILIIFHVLIYPLIALKPGQVWLWQSRNKFQGLLETNTVLAVEHGYVQYQSVYEMYPGNLYTNIRSSSAGYFLLGSTKLK